MTKPWVKLYRAERGAFAQLPFLTRCVAAEILKLTNDEGRIELGRRPPADAICFAMGAEKNERRAVRRHIELLLEDGYIVHDGERGELVFPGWPRFQGLSPDDQRTSEALPPRAHGAPTEPTRSPQRAATELPACSHGAPSVRPHEAKLSESLVGTDRAGLEKRRREGEETREEDQKIDSPASDEAESLSVRTEITSLESRLDQKLCVAAREACALSRRTGKLADTVWLRTLRAISAHPAPIANEAMRLYAERYGDGEKDERYMIGIARGLAKGRGPRRGGGGMMPESTEFGPSPDESELGRLFG